jgi:hypothetical protein
MYNPDQHYAAHTIYLKELSEQAEQRRMIAALSQGRPARIRVSGWRLGVLLVRLRTWPRKPDGRGKIVALASSACGNTGGACDAEGNQSCAYCTQA